VVAMAAGVVAEMHGLGEPINGARWLRDQKQSPKMKAGPNRSRTGDFGMNGYGVLQSYTLPLSYRPMLLLVIL
jgi:hypothetical protein